jgi:fluoroacetyl-CoA thioesterase
VVSVSSLGSLGDVPRPAQSTLASGLEHTFEFTTEGQLLTDVGGTLAVRVLSTPGMVAVMERTCALLALENLPVGKASVGFEICVKHVAGAPEGVRCRSHARLREIVDGRKLRFDVEVRARERTIGLGTHERRVIDVAEHAASQR